MHERSWARSGRTSTLKEHSRHFQRKTEAQKWLDYVTASVVRGDYVDPGAGRVTFNDFYIEWAARQSWAPTTVKAMSLAARSVTFGTVPLRSLKRSHVEEWVKWMNSDTAERPPLAPGTIHTRFNNVHTVLRAAVRDRLIPNDPATGVTLPRRRRAEHALVLPTTEEVGNLLAVSDAEFRPFIALCAFAGLRLGEVAGLQVVDINFLQRSVSVRRQVQRRDGGAVSLSRPKYGRERTVSLPGQLVEMLAKHVRDTGAEGDMWLFQSPTGGPLHQNTAGHRWRRTREQAGLPQLRLHDLRHYYASGLIFAGCDVVTVQRALGHQSVNFTLRTYSHLWPRADDRTRDAATGLMASAMGRTADSVRTADH